VNCAPNNQIREMSGFNECPNLRRIEIPLPVEIVQGFSFCDLLSELIFPPDSHFQKIIGFTECETLSRIEFPSSIKYIKGFSNC
jgi:hypothetical protein